MIAEIFIERRKRRKRKLMIIDNKVVFRKRLEHSFELEPEVAAWARQNVDVLDWLVFDSPIATSLRHPHSIRTLLYLLYARVNGISVTQIAKKVGIAHEQLYRLERLLSRAGLKESVIEVLKAARE